MQDLRYSFDKEVRAFTKRIDSLRATLPVLMNAVSTAKAQLSAQYTKFVTHNGILLKKSESSGDGSDTYSIPPEHLRSFRIIERASSDYGISCEILPQMFILSLISQFDAYLSRLMRGIFYKCPQILNASNKTLTYADLARINSMDAAREYLIEKEIETVLRDSHSQHFDWLESKMKIPFRKDLESWSRYIEITERRNLFTHCDGIVSSQYLSVCKEHSVIGIDKVTLGDRLGAEPEYCQKAFECFLEIGFKLGQVIWRKVAPEQYAEADSNLIHTTYELIQAEEYAVAISLLEFAVRHLKNFLSSQERHLMNVLNLAQAYKWSGKENECADTLRVVDWSPMSAKLRLGAAVLREHYQEAAELMETIGTHSTEVSAGYRDWPIFKKFRKTPEFLETYKKVYKNPFSPEEAVTKIEKPEENKPSSQKR